MVLSAIIVFYTYLRKPVLMRSGSPAASKDALTNGNVQAQHYVEIRFLGAVSKELDRQRKALLTKKHVQVKAKLFMFISGLLKVIQIIQPILKCLSEPVAQQ